MAKIDFGPAQRRRCAQCARAADTMVPLYGRLLHQTAKAYLILPLQDGREPVWLPKSQLVEDQAGFWLAPNWLMRAKGFLDSSSPSS